MAERVGAYTNIEADNFSRQYHALMSVLMVICTGKE
jgi:hypothetical protein